MQKIAVLHIFEKFHTGHEFSIKLLFIHLLYCLFHIKEFTVDTLFQATEELLKN